MCMHGRCCSYCCGRKSSWKLIKGAHFVVWLDHSNDEHSRKQQSNTSHLNILTQLSKRLVKLLIILEQIYRLVARELVQTKYCGKCVSSNVPFLHCWSQSHISNMSKCATQFNEQPAAIKSCSLRSESYYQIKKKVLECWMWQSIETRHGMREKNLVSGCQCVCLCVCVYLHINALNRVISIEIESEYSSLRHGKIPHWSVRYSHSVYLMWDESDLIQL